MHRAGVHAPAAADAGGGTLHPGIGFREGQDGVVLLEHRKLIVHQGEAHHRPTH